MNQEQLYVRILGFRYEEFRLPTQRFSYVLVEVIRELLTYGYQIEMGHVLQTLCQDPGEHCCSKGIGCYRQRMLVQKA